MNKDEQIKYLKDTLKVFSSDFWPWHGENALLMEDYAKDALTNFDRILKETKLEGEEDV